MRSQRRDDMRRRFFVCYAAGAPVHYLNRARLLASARRHDIDEVLAFGPEDIDVAFRSEHRAIFDLKEGAGYWLWKPYFILKTMRRAALGDLILYVDSGAHLRLSLDRLWGAIANADVDAILFENDYLNRAFVKRDAFILTGTDVTACHESRQLDAALMLFRNTPATQEFVQNWLFYCTDSRIVTDAPNTCGERDIPGFVAHRHDQSVLSLLFWRDRRQLKTVLYPRAHKHKYIVHHRRRTASVPIWFWHAFHDGAEALVRRTLDVDFDRT
jgi:hypothetical protein